MADKDLSYTNKDGLNPAAGFTNVFNYHKDGASEGEGYATGGYPEITGETSSLPNKNYKTGDDPDFFDNGNVWEQTQPEPGPGPTPTEGYTVTLKPAVITGEGSISGIDPASVTTDGTFINLVEGDVYNVVYNGTTYKNQVVKAITITTYSTPYTILGLGNLDAVMLRSTYATDLTEEQRGQLVDSDIPFAIVQTSTDMSEISAVFLGTETTQAISATRISDSQSYTLSFTSSELSLFSGMIFIAPESYDYMSEKLDIEAGHSLKVIIDGEETEGTWEIEGQAAILLLDGYDIEHITSMPIIASTASSDSLVMLTFMNATSTQQLTATFLKKEGPDDSLETDSNN